MNETQIKQALEAIKSKDRSALLTALDEAGLLKYDDELGVDGWDPNTLPQTVSATLTMERAADEIFTRADGSFECVYYDNLFDCD